MQFHDHEQLEENSKNLREVMDPASVLVINMPFGLLMTVSSNIGDEPWVVSYYTLASHNGHLLDYLQVVCFWLVVLARSRSAPRSPSSICGQVYQYRLYPRWRCVEVRLY